MRKSLATKLVALDDYLLNHAYIAHEEKRFRLERLWWLPLRFHFHDLGIRIEKESAVDRMIESGWWG